MNSGQTFKPDSTQSESVVNENKTEVNPFLSNKPAFILNDAFTVMAVHTKDLFTAFKSFPWY
jgi:hypothetical protein